MSLERTRIPAGPMRGLILATLPGFFLAAGSPVAAAVETTSGASGGVCRLVLPPGELVRADWTSAGRLEITLRGGGSTSTTANGSPCVTSLTILPAPGGRTVSLEFAPGALRSIEADPGGAVLLFRMGGDPASSNLPGAYRIGVGDKLTISVPSHAISEEVEVDPNGTVTFQYAGTVPLEGLTPTEAAERLRQELDRKSLVDPKVSVVVKEYASQFVFVTGEVRKPGKVPLKGATTLKDVLAEAGGLEREASDEITVTRQHEGGEAEVFRFSRAKVEGDAANLSLHPRDEVHVAERRYFFIQGEVQLPNKYAFSPGVTLMQSIAIANGLKEWANRREVRILRTGDGRAEKLVFDLRDIERQKAPDPVLEPGDIIIVPRRLM